MKEAEKRGLRLLQKSKKGLLRVVFSRTGFVTLLLIFNILLLFSMHQYFLELLPHATVAKALLVLAMVLYLLNSKLNPTAKITWLIMVMLFPTFSAPLYFFIELDVGHRTMKRRMGEIMAKSRSALKQRESTLRKLQETDPAEARLQAYLSKVGDFPVYDQCRMSYFSCGEEKFEALKQQLETAKRFIFLEYFIVEEGRMWGEILEILARKAKSGVDVRVMYDGSCEFSTLPRNYPEMLKKLGIQCKVFAPATPFVSTHYNYRDHRKIAVVDGRVAFTGGVNLADEYINEFPKYGHWKDAALMLEGEAARSFSLMFLQMWNLGAAVPEISPYLKLHANRMPEEKGFVIPYADSPLDEYRVGEMVYLDILNRATKYVHIMSPYLILDSELELALRFAAQRGVEVSLILPGIPDKNYVYALAKTHYQSLLSAGVKIYEYTPGFVHSKVFVSDDIRGVVGTINLDYRSLYHHFECAAYVYGCDCIAHMEKDFQNTLSLCRKVTAQNIKEIPLAMKLQGWLMKGFSPLF